MAQDTLLNLKTIIYTYEQKTHKKRRNIRVLHTTN